LIDIIGSPSSNAKSVYFAFKDLGIDCRIVTNASEIGKSKKIVLPGVGAFGALSEFLNKSEFLRALNSRLDENAKLLGICLGMQMLGESSEESESGRGLSVFPLRCRKFDPEKLRVPHTGWDQVVAYKHHQILEGLGSEFSAFFSHSYYIPHYPEYSLAVTSYGSEFSAVIAKGNVVGVQFHPERSQRNGRRLLSNFADW
jgi:glutamine amidotransferase